MKQNQTTRQEADVKNCDLPDDADRLAEQALLVLQKLRHRGFAIATAESCTGGLLASLLTDQEGFGRCFDRGFVTYTNQAKVDQLSINHADIARFGAVSAEVATAMAQGALSNSEASLAVGITGFAGPAGRDDEVGLVYLALAMRDGTSLVHEHHFGNLSRDRVRFLAAQRALEMIDRAAGERSS